MGIKSWLGIGTKADKPQPKNVLNVFSRQQPGIPIYTDLTVQKSVREGYKLSLYVYRAVRTIVQAASGIPWVVIDNETGEQIPNHPFTTAWANPNPHFSGQDNMEFIVAHLKLAGNSLIQPIMVNGKPREFWVCMPDMIQPIPSEVPSEWLKGYQISDTTGRQSTVPPETFIHFMQFDPGNPYWGMGDLKAAGRTVDTDNEAQDTQKVSMQNRGTPDGVFVNEGITNKEQYDEAVRQVKEQYLPKDNKRAPWVIGGNTKWYQMSLSPVEMDYLNTRVRNKQDIFAAFGLDAWWGGDKSQSSYNNVVEAKKGLYEIVVIPFLDDIKSTLNLKVRKYYPDAERITISYDISGIPALRADYGQKVDQAQKLWSMGVPLSQANTILELGIEEFPGWDESHLPFSVVSGGSKAQESIPGQKTVVGVVDIICPNCMGMTPVESLAPVNDQSVWHCGKCDKIFRTKQTKAALQTEEQKTAYWRRIDSRRQAWANVLGKKIAPLYEEMGQVVADNQGSVEAVINSQSSKWEKVLIAAGQVLIEDFGKQVEEQLKTIHRPTERKFDPFTPAMRAWLAKHAAESVKTILETQKQAMHDIINKGVADKLSVTQIAKSIRGFYTDNANYLAMRVARTECSTAAGYGQSQAAKQMGANRKYFITSRDDRVRDSHAAMDGEEKDLDEPYSNGQMYPGDPNVDPSEFIDCRCVEGYLKG
jgi:HK97 family phage portal protein